MQKIKCTISYDGTNFSGYQIQPNKRTIQGEIEKVLSTMHKGEFVRIYSSGRTDTGVHARRQVFHFETDLQIAEDNWKRALNSQLPEDIFVHQVEKVDEPFHARFSAQSKEYRYFVLLTEERDVFLRHYRYMTREQFDIAAIEAACKVFEGTHDFTAFSSARSTVKGDKVRTLYEVSVSQQDNELCFILRGNGFLYHMARIIVSVLLDAGKGLVSPKEIKEMFAKKSRGTIGKTLPPEGLFLWQVHYENEAENKRI